MQAEGFGISPENNFFIQGFLAMAWFMFPASMVVGTVLLSQTERANRGILKMLSLPVGLASIVPSVLIINTKAWFACPMSYPFFVITAEYGKFAANFDTAQVELLPWIPAALVITILCLGISCLRFGQAETP